MRPALLVLTGCSKLLGFEPAVTGDATPPEDGEPGDGGSTACVGGAGLMPKLCTQATGLLRLEGLLDTSNDARCDVTRPELCVVFGGTIEISDTVVATGTRPLVVAGIEGIDVSGVLVASSSKERIGPAANFAGCSTLDGEVRNEAPIAFGGGGGGGGYGSTGGNGGAGRVSSATTQSTLGGTASPLGLHGGCPGGRGGLSGLPGGDGGGVVYLVSGGTIRITGLVEASGAGGAGGVGNLVMVGGGAGGGSGGLLALEAPAIELVGATLVALGGGGGSGGSVGSNGSPGSAPNSFPPAIGPGGQPSAPSNSGGSGGSVAGGSGSSGGAIAAGSEGGGGGGGGGAGYIAMFGNVSSDAPTTIAPPP